MVLGGRHAVDLLVIAVIGGDLLAVNRLVSVLHFSDGHGAMYGASRDLIANSVARFVPDVLGRSCLRRQRENQHQR